MKSKCARRGFTLIELLTVVAIIAILAAMLFIAGPRVIEMARLANLQNTCNQIRTIAVAYLASKQSLPPAYGYKLGTGGYNIKPYLAFFDNEFGNFKIYDPFGLDTYDTDQDGVLSLLEYCPIGTRDAIGNPIFLPGLYVGPSSVPVEENLQRNAKQRPLVYIPVNLKDAEKVRDYYLLLAALPDPVRARDGEYGNCWRPNESLAPAKNPLSARIVVPPRKYDAFVLISVGPNHHTGGILTPPPEFIADLNDAGIAPKDYYYYFALRAYYLATRDANKDGNLDFDYQNRVKGNDDKKFPLPDGSMRPGPVIYHFAG